MAINFDKLNKDKTYVCLEYGTGKISKLIQRFTKEYCPNAKEVPSHVFTLVYDKRLCTWLVYESHASANKVAGIKSGTRKYLQVLLENYFPDVVLHTDCYQVDININSLEKDLNKPYGLGDISRLMRAAILNRNGKQSDFPGLICSEYIARAYHPIQIYLGLKPHCITPAHWLDYLLENNIPKV